MALRQRIIPSRREYNQWVADETLEDYALRFTAVAARKWSAGSVANTALGATSFLALEAIGGAVTLRCGFANTVAAILFVGLLIFLTALPIAICAARHGLDIDLLTRGAGFGYIGSTMTSLVYATFTFIFFAIEASILAATLELCIGLPLPVGYVLAAVVVIPIVTHGITAISRFHRLTQPLWIGLNVLPFILIAVRGDFAFAGWTQFRGDSDGLALLPFAAAASIIVSLIAQVGEQVDFLRFLPLPAKGWRWWLAVVAAGPGWIVPGIAKLLAGSFLAWLALRSGLPARLAIQPSVMYATAFATACPTWVALTATVVLVAVAQLKINVTNAYAGSIAWSNFFSRLTRSHPGRVVWVVFNVAIALTLMEIGLYRAIEGVLSLFSILATGWIGALVADLVVIKPLGLAPARFDFRRAHLYDVNPVGVGAMVAAVGAGVAAHAGAFGPLAEAGAPFVSLALAFLTAPAIAWLTGGRFYLARRPRRDWATQAAGKSCVVCGNRFEPADTAFCPAYGGVICSLCCSLDARCHDACKPHARTAAQLRNAFVGLTPGRIRPYLQGPLPRFCAIFAVAAGLIGVIMLAIFLQTETATTAGRVMLVSAMWRAYVILAIIAGVAAWLLVLAQETRSAAQQETRRQTTLLLSEIAAHRRTDAKLQKAKEAAEAANLAKSRFVVGITHELRTPLNAVLGYAQILERDQAIPAHRRGAIRTIRRSGEHLAGLIEGLLDISKIEAGRVEINRREVRLAEFFDPLVDMFRFQANRKGIDFQFHPSANLSAVVHTDETRLRQILINLLSNAIKFTQRGAVVFSARRRGEVTEFQVTDSGVGIGQDDIQRIFEPFERVEPAGGPMVPGVGLGLTITKLLTEILGGEISVTSQPGKGSTFMVRLLLPEVAHPKLSVPIRRLSTGYEGRRRLLIVADDDATHRAMLDETLTPIGFEVLTVPDAASCLHLAAQCRPDAFVLDVSMPDLDGWTLARLLREGSFESTTILLVSAHPDDPSARFGERRLHDGFLSKPVDLSLLVQLLGDRLGLTWTDSAVVPQAEELNPVPLQVMAHADDLDRLVTTGQISALKLRLEELALAYPKEAPFIDQMRRAAEACRLDDLAAILQTAQRRDVANA